MAKGNTRGGKTTASKPGGKSPGGKTASPFKQGKKNGMGYKTHKKG